MEEKHKVDHGEVDKNTQFINNILSEKKNRQKNKFLQQKYIMTVFLAPPR